MITSFDKFATRHSIVAEKNTVDSNKETKWAKSMIDKYEGESLAKKVKAAADAEKNTVKAYMRMDAFLELGCPELAAMFADKAESYMATLHKGGGNQTPSYDAKAMQTVKDAEPIEEAKKSVEVESPDSFELCDRLTGRKGIYNVGCVTVTKANVYYNDKIHTEADIKSMVSKENQTIKESAGSEEKYKEIAESILEEYVPPFEYEDAKLDSDNGVSGKTVFIEYTDVNPLVIEELSSDYERFEDEYLAHIDRYLTEHGMEDMKAVFNGSASILSTENSITYEIVYLDKFLR